MGNSSQGDYRVKNDRQNLEPRMTSPTEHKTARHASLTTRFGSVFLPRLLVTEAGKTFGTARASRERGLPVSALEMRRQHLLRYAQMGRPFRLPRLGRGSATWAGHGVGCALVGGVQSLDVAPRSSYDQNSREPIRGSNWRI